MLSISVSKAEWSNAEVFRIESAVTLKCTLIGILNKNKSSVLAQTLYKILSWMAKQYLDLSNLFFITWTLAFLWFRWLGLRRKTTDHMADAMTSLSLFEVKDTDRVLLWPYKILLSSKISAFLLGLTAKLMRQIQVYLHKRTLTNGL